MSIPFAPRAILIASARVDTELCVQQDQQYLLCEVLVSTIIVTQRELFGQRVADDGNLWVWEQE